MGYAMKDGRNCIICKGIHGDESRKWPYCRVSKQWVTLLGIMPENYGDMSEGLKILNFIGLAADYSSPTVQFNAMCLAHLMHTAHNKLRHGKDGLNFDIGREDDTIDWASRTLADAAHGHRYMSNILTDRGLFSTSLCGRVSNENKKKRIRESVETLQRTEVPTPARMHRTLLVTIGGSKVRLSAPRAYRLSSFRWASTTVPSYYWSPRLLAYYVAGLGFSGQYLGYSWWLPRTVLPLFTHGFSCLSWCFTGLTLDSRSSALGLVALLSWASLALRSRPFTSSRLWTCRCCRLLGLLLGWAPRSY